MYNMARQKWQLTNLVCKMAAGTVILDIFSHFYLSSLLVDDRTTRYFDETMSKFCIGVYVLASFLSVVSGGGLK